jgi:uncharacterized protein YcbK (DUF882 family)
VPQLTKHFHSREFNCKDGTPVPSRDMNGLEALCRQYLEPMRKKYGPCTVHSGFRTPSHNARVGGASMSYHVYTRHDGNDQAADVSFAKGSPADWHRTASWLRSRRRGGRGGIGRYSSFIHIDLRDYKADWRG